MATFQRKGFALAGVVATVGLWWYFLAENEGPVARLMAGPISVSYDAESTRLTATVNILNSGDRPTVASITSAVFVDSQKQALTVSSGLQPVRAELTSKQSSPVIFSLEGERAAAVWNGIELMEVTISAAYEGNAKLSCNFSLMGRFYSQIKQIGTVSSATSPRQCR